MELITAIEILEYHQEWRSGRRDDMIHEPSKLTEALNLVIQEAKKIRSATTYPTDEDLDKEVDKFTKDFDISNYSLVAVRFGYREGLYKMLDTWKVSNKFYVDSLDDK